ncbi:hypothetical protein B0T22DRAFT_502515 [Podospora appendiculata]|uniref:DUF6594 domain-containing protein n=1 Tax=Podospora appendiculata TaxID=314037 RepID=A0AAE1C752_9PEZI|nr:hypothetical protein B0T22DRAFT_502515 [Podospora appendiculata]
MESQSRASYVDGCPSLAAFIASDKDGTAVIFKRFNQLAARNLLFLQSEIAELQAQLDAFDAQDSDISNHETIQSLRNWNDYKSRASTDPSRMNLVCQIRETLREYREALLFESTLASIPPPGRKTLKAFRLNSFHGRQEDHGSFPTLGGNSSTLYDDAVDLLALHAVEQRDRMTVFVQDNFGPTLNGGSGNSSSLDYASESKIASFISYLSVVLAAMLLFGAILILYNTKSDNLKLGLLAFFTILFAASVGLLTNAKRSEVFGSTAAYAAVLVVFASGNLGS